MDKKELNQVQKEQINLPIENTQNILMGLVSLAQNNRSNSKVLEGVGKIIASFGVTNNRENIEADYQPLAQNGLAINANSQSWVTELSEKYPDLLTKNRAKDDILPLITQIINLAVDENRTNIKLENEVQTVLELFGANEEVTTAIGEAYAKGITAGHESAQIAEEIFKAL
jgi:hypothetical protein